MSRLRVVDIRAHRGARRDVRSRVVKLAVALAFVLAASTARAEHDVDLPKLGLRLDVGGVPNVMAFGLEVGVEHPVAGKLRAFGEFEWLWLTGSTSTDSDVGGVGQRAHVGVRHVLAATKLRNVLRFFVDGELGGGFTLMTDNMTGAHAIPHALAGVRLGYDIVQHARTLECDLVFRAIVVEHAASLMFGVGVAWGG
jgi:hypothetical protein